MACIVLLAIKSQSNPVDSTHDCTHCQASHCACMTSTGPLHWTLSRLVFADHWAVYAHNDNPWMGVYFCEKQVIMKHTHITHGQTYFVFPFPWMVSSWPVPNPHHQYERCRAEAGYSRVADLFQHLYKKKIECRRIMIKVIKTTNKQTKNSGLSTAATNSIQIPAYSRVTRPPTHEAKSPVLREEVEQAVYGLKAGRSPGVDNIPS